MPKSIIKADGDGANTINVHVVRTLMSRFVCLKELGESIMVWEMKENSFRKLYGCQKS